MQTIFILAALINLTAYSSDTCSATTRIIAKTIPKEVQEIIDSGFCRKHALPVQREVDVQPYNNGYNLYMLMHTNGTPCNDVIIIK